LSRFIVTDEIAEVNVEANVIEIAPVGFFAFGPGPSGEEPDEPEQDNEPKTETPEREEAPETDAKPTHPQREDEKSSR
jgi:hypothetical protein